MIRSGKLGEGTYGIVYQCSSPTSNKQFAVKRNLSDLDNSYIGVVRELDILTKTRGHPNVVKLEQVAFGDPFSGAVFSPLNKKDRRYQKDDTVHFLFQKASYDLHKFIHRKYDLSQVKKFMVHILLGLEFLHSKKIIHRDLKPCNILIFEDEVDTSGSKGVAKICDFGLSKPFTKQGQQTPGVVSSWYRAPEIALDNPHYNLKSDVWSAGCVLFELFAKTSFIVPATENNDDVLSCILGALPQQLESEKFKELVRQNKWRKVRLNKNHSPRVRKTFQARLPPETPGLEDFCDLLTGMLTFDFQKRFTVSQALDHPFFDNFSPLIQSTRKEFLEEEVVPRVYCPKAIEHTWMSRLAIEIYNSRNERDWFTPRMLFQAMDLFDCYLTAALTAERPASAVESEFRGLVHDKPGTELRFMVCVYIALKYFSSLHRAISFEKVLPKELHSPEAFLIAEQFEGGLIKNCFEYNIYRDTIYEAADYFGDILGEEEVRDLVVLYTRNAHLGGKSVREVYSHYMENLKGKFLTEFKNAF